MNIADLFFTIETNGSEEAINKIDKLSNKFVMLGDTITNIGTNLIEKVTKPIVEGLTYSLMSASDLVEGFNVVDTTFGKSATAVRKWAKSLIADFGLTETEAINYSGAMGAMLKSSGLSTKASKEMSTSLVELTGDMSSFYNLEHDETWEKIRSGISGETEPLKALGINMSVANLEAFALSQGINTAWNEMTQAEQVTLRYNYLMEQTSDAQGDFAKTSTGFANGLRVITGKLQSFAVKIGTLLLPYAEKLISVLNDWADKLNGLNDNQTKMALIISLIVAGIPILITIFGVLVTVLGVVIGSVTTIITVLSSVSLPVLAVIAVIGGLIATFTTLILSSENVRSKIISKFQAMGNKIKEVVSFIKNHISEIKQSFIDLKEGLDTGDFSNLRDTLKSFIPADMQEKVLNIVNAIDKLQNGFVLVREKVFTFFTYVQNIASPIIDMFKESFSSFNIDSIVTAFTNLWNQLQVLTPLFQGLGIFIGGTLATYIGIAIGVWNGLIIAIDRIIAMFGNLLTFITSVMGLIIGIVTGDTEMIKTSFLNMITSVKDFFVNGFMAIVEFVVGFVEGIVEWFTTLYDVLVGHSIVPDMINAVIEWFFKLISKPINYVKSLYNKVVNYFKALKSAVIAVVTALYNKVVSEFKKFTSNPVAYIKAMATKIKNHIKSLASDVKSKVASIYSNFLNKWKTLKSNVVNVVSGMVKSIKNKINSLKDAISNVMGKLGDLVTKATGLSIPGFANGVTNFGGGLAVVGEQGAELMYLPQGTNVYSHEDSKKMLSGAINTNSGSSPISTSSEVFNLNGDIVIDAKSISEVNDIINVFKNLKLSYYSK